MASAIPIAALLDILDVYFRAATAPAAFKLALATAVGPADEYDANVWPTDITELAGGSGYTSGGKVIARSAVGFDTTFSDETTDEAYVLVTDQTWTATGGGTIGPASFAILYEDTQNEIDGIGDFAGSKEGGTDADFTVQDMKLRLKKPA